LICFKIEFHSVITGVRFNTFYETFFLQIEIGELGPMATVIQGTVHWKPLDNLTRENFDKLIISDFKTNGNKFSLEKTWLIEPNFLTCVEFERGERFWRLKICGKIVNLQSTAFAILESVDDQYSNSTKGFTELDISGKKPGLGSGSDFIVTKNKFIDLSKTNSPIFDTSDVTFDIKAPLSGIGFLHYTKSNDHVGLIKPYLISFDYRTLLEKIYFNETRH
jgi:hypothetical protein